MSEPRVCGACGLPEIRTDRFVNLEPSTGYCVDCLIAMSREARDLPPEPRTADLFDARAAAANLEDRS